VNPIAVVQGNGVRVGEGTTLYPVLGVETGFVSNVFYDDTNPTGAGILRILGEAGIGSLSATRLSAENPPERSPADPMTDVGSFQYRADLYAAWDQYLSGNDNVQSQGGLSGGLVIRGIGNPNHPIFVSFLEHFSRVLRPTNFESDQDTNRDINNFQIRLNYQPVGRSLGGYVYYRHTLDLFEEDAQQFADRFDHALGVRVNYQWLPLTRLYIDISQGIYGGVGSSSTKVSSYPFTGVAGVQTMLSVNTTVNARIGYTQGFYSSGPDFATVTGGVQLGYRYSPLGRVTVLYNYDHQDSINANFYRDHVIAAMFEQQVNPFLVFVRPELHLRHYEGIMLPGVVPSSPNRDDTIFAVMAGARYNWRNWLAATLEYHLALDQTDFRYTFMGIPDDPSYVRHEVMLGVRGAF
jgi:opacity protein-like surface antigen